MALKRVPQLWLHNSEDSPVFLQIFSGSLFLVKFKRFRAGTTRIKQKQHLRGKMRLTCGCEKIISEAWDNPTMLSSNQWEVIACQQVEVHIQKLLGEVREKICEFAQFIQTWQRLCALLLKKYVRLGMIAQMAHTRIECKLARKAENAIVEFHEDLLLNLRSAMKKIMCTWLRRYRYAH